MSYATVSDLAARWRTLSPNEQTIATALLQDASDLLDLKVGSRELTQQQQNVRKQLVCKAVRRAMSSFGDAYGFDSEVGRLDLQENPAGDLYFLDSELDYLGVGRQIGTAPLVTL